MYELPSVEPMSKVQIWQRAFEVYLEYVREVGAEHVLRHGVSFDELYDAVIYPKYEVILDRNEYLDVDDEGVPILGEFLAKENVALVDRKLFENSDPRTVFTECHEVIGHGILHGPFLRKNARKYPKLYSTEKGMGLTKGGFDWRTLNTFEWQANAFGVNVLAPRNFVYCICIKLFDLKHKINYRGPGCYHICLNNTKFTFYIYSVKELAWKIARLMKHYFGGLSSESLSYQVLEVAISNTVYNNYRCEFAPTLGEIMGT